MKLYFTFFAAIVAMFALNNRSFSVVALAACGIHEISHIIAMLIMGITPDTVTFYAGGIKINSIAIENAPIGKRALVLSAGCLANFVIALFFWLSGNVVAAMINLFTGIYNLLPFGEFDGAGLLKMLVISLCRAERVDRVMGIIRMVLGLVLAVVVVGVGGMIVLNMTDLYDL